MQRIFAIFALCALSSAELIFSDADEAQFAKIKADCAKAENIDASYIQRTDSLDFPTYEEVKCYPYCVFSTFGIMTKAGDFDLEFLKSRIPADQQDVYVPVVSECAKVQADGKCRKGYEGYKCYSLKAHA